MSWDLPFSPEGRGGVGQQEKETPQTPWSSETSFPIIVITIIVTSAALKVFTFIEHLMCPWNRAESFLYIPSLMPTTTPMIGTVPISTSQMKKLRLNQVKGWA